MKEATLLTNLPTREPRPTPAQAQGLPRFLAKQVSTLTAIPITPPPHRPIPFPTETAS